MKRDAHWHVRSVFFGFSLVQLMQCSAILTAARIWYSAARCSLARKVGLFWLLCRPIDAVQRDAHCCQDLIQCSAMLTVSRIWYRAARCCAFFLQARVSFCSSMLIASKLLLYHLLCFTVSLPLCPLAEGPNFLWCSFFLINLGQACLLCGVCGGIPH